MYNLLEIVRHYMCNKFQMEVQSWCGPVLTVQNHTQGAGVRWRGCWTGGPPLGVEEPRAEAKIGGQDLQEERSQRSASALAGVLRVVASSIK